MQSVRSCAVQRTVGMPTDHDSYLKNTVLLYGYPVAVSITPQCLKALWVRKVRYVRTSLPPARQSCVPHVPAGTRAGAAARLLRGSPVRLV